MTHILGQRAKSIFICCGCDDDHACPGGCTWVLLDIPESGFPLTGICSTCAIALDWNPVALRDVGFAEAS